MKHIAILFSLLLSMVVISCEESNGYPQKIHFPPEGGTQTFIGKGCFVSFEIIDGSKSYSSKDLDLDDFLMIASSNWLTVKTRRDSLIVTAKPAPSSKKRKATIYCDFGYAYCDIDVVQGR